MAGNMMESVLVVLVVIVLLVVLYQAATIGGTVSSLSSQIGAVKSAVSNIQIPQQSVNLDPAISAIKRNMTTLSDFSLVGFTLPANQSRVIFDTAGLGGAFSVEMNVKLDEIGAIPADVQVQVLNVTTLQWQNVGEAASAPAKGTFPIQALGDVHNDEQGVAAVRLVNLDPTNAAVFNNDAFVSLTMNGRAS